MPLEDIQLASGIVTERSARGAAPQYKDCDHIRFVDGLPQLIGGWRKYGNDTDGFLQIQTSWQKPEDATLDPTPDSSVTVSDYVRVVHEWASLDNQSWIAIGTERRLYLINLFEQGATPGLVHNITPLESSGTLGTDPFNVTSGSAYVLVTHTSHGLEDRQLIVLKAPGPGDLTFNGVTIAAAGTSFMVEVVDANTYWIVLPAAATSTDTTAGGAGILFEYEIAPPPVNEQSIGGWGVSGWGSDSVQNGGFGWSTPRSSDPTGNPLELRLWSLDNWGEDLIASRRAEPIYVWDKTLGATVRATLISAAPAQNNRVLVSPEDRHLISIGSHDGTQRDQMLVRWSDAEDYNNWTPVLTTNSAGDKRLDAGSRVITALRTRTETLIWTDRSMYSMRFDPGSDDIFSFQPLGENVQIISQYAMAEAAGTVYFMGEGDFYVYDGLVRPLPCPVRNHVFDFLSKDAVRKQKIVASTNRKFSEVWWFYPVSNDENSRYVIYNYREQVWYFGILTRTTFRDAGPFLGYPFGFDTNGYLITHENGYTDNGNDLDAYIETHDFEIGSGDGFEHISKIVPDFVDMSKTVQVTLRAKRYPHSTSVTTKGPYDITPTTERNDFRIRGRQISLLLESTGLNNFWRVGTWRREVIQHGRR